MGFLTRWQPQLYAILRIVAGLLFLEHGTQKLLGFPPMATQVPDQFMMVIMVAGAIELVAGALITIGLFTRIAAFIASGEMAVAFWVGHVAQRHVFWPALNEGDAAILFCFLFLYIAAAGAGRWSIDRP